MTGAHSLDRLIGNEFRLLPREPTSVPSNKSLTLTASPPRAPMMPLSSGPPSIPMHPPSNSSPTPTRQHAE